MAATLHPLLAKGVDINSWAGTAGERRVFQETVLVSTAANQTAIPPQVQIPADQEEVAHTKSISHLNSLGSHHRLITFSQKIHKY